MKYAIKSHPTEYAGTLFRSRLEAQWAAFFDLVGWEWKYEPIDLPGWTPDFWVRFECGHSDCPDCHSLLVEVKPYHSIGDFNGHPCTTYYFGFKLDNKTGEETRIDADSSAAFGLNPQVTYWEMSHGAGGGIEKVANWVYAGIDVDEAWEMARRTVQYKGPK